jgi:thiol-disulfide isomerase/thioredoxin
MLKKFILTLSLILLPLSVWAQQLPKEFLTAKNPPKVTLLEFSAPWCLSCQKIKPTVEKLEKDLGSKLKVVYLNVDKPETQKYLSLYKIDSAPTFILFNAKGQQVKRVDEELTSEQFQKLIQTSVNQ